MELSSNALIDEIKSDIQKQMLRLGQPNVRYIKDMDRALVGSCVNDAGMVVPIYSNQMCIDCLAEQFPRTARSKKARMIWPLVGSTTIRLAKFPTGKSSCR